MPLGAVANRAPLCDVASHAANGKPCLIAEAFGKLHEPVRVGEVTDQAERDPHRTRALAAAARDQLEKAAKVHIGVELESRTHVGLRDPFCGFARARIAKAAGSQ